MTFPIALEAYADIEESNELLPEWLIAREVVHNEIEAKQFENTFSGHKIVTRPLKPNELSDPRIN